MLFIGIVFLPDVRHLKAAMNAIPRTVENADSHTSAPVKPWSIHRQILWLKGALGLLLLWMGLIAAFVLQGGFGPGSNTSPPGLADLVLVILCSVIGVHYILVAYRTWTRRLWRTGLALHGIVIIYFVANGELAGIPLILAWAIAWVVYARRNAFVEI
jgi:hypothetical protein